MSSSRVSIKWFGICTGELTVWALRNSGERAQLLDHPLVHVAPGRWREPAMLYLEQHDVDDLVCGWVSESGAWR